MVNNPAGLNTHAPSPYAGEGIYDWLRHREPRWAKLAIIHRLDKETSGVMVFSKTPLANRSLTEQFTAHSVRKKYLLLTDRAVRPGEIVAKSALVRAGDRYVSRPVHAGGETAETRFRVVGKAGVSGGGPKSKVQSPKSDGGTRLGEVGSYAEVEAEPVTGRTHQIRVHAAEKGFPILGDTLYGGTPAARVYLHAAELTLKQPDSGEEMTFRAPIEQGTHDAGATQGDWIGVRPSSGAAISANTGCSELSNALGISEPAAPEDGRTPRWPTGPLPCLTLREGLIDLEETNAYRLIHGASDRQPGWYVDRLGDFLLSQSEAPLSATQREELGRLTQVFSARGAYHKILRRRAGRAPRAEASPQLVLGEAAPERFTVRENGVQFELSFSEGYSVGLFLDQRDNRRRLLTGHVGAGFPLLPRSPESPIANGKWQILNTFAYTCGFSV